MAVAVAVEDTIITILIRTMLPVPPVVEGLLSKTPWRRQEIEEVHASPEGVVIEEEEEVVEAVCQSRGLPFPQVRPLMIPVRTLTTLLQPVGVERVIHHHHKEEERAEVMR